MNITLKNFLELVITGATWDLIKYGTKSLVLRPFVEAFEKLNAQNNDGIRIGRYIFKFEESDVIISSINQRGVFHIVPMVFNEIIKNYDHLKYPNSQRFPDEIRVPIIYDENLKNEYSKYRELIEMEDIELDLDDDNYFKFWGLCYNFDQQHMIYSHKDKKVLNDSFYTAANFEDYLARKR